MSELLLVDKVTRVMRSWLPRSLPVLTSTLRPFRVVSLFSFSAKTIVQKSDTNNAGAVANNNAGTTALSVVETNGSLDGEIGEDETIDNYVNFFGDSSKKATAKDSIFDKNINQVKKFESKRSITLDNPSEASADSSDKGDTYTYLTLQVQR